MMRLHFGGICFICCIAASLGQYWCDSFRGSSRSQEWFTVGGTVPGGTACCFPFIFENRAYNACTTVKHTSLWCGVESVYQQNTKLWGNCRQITTPAPSPDIVCNAPSTKSAEFVTQGGTVPAGTPCCFPFVYNNRDYNGCTTADHNGRAWCAVETVYSSSTKKWGNCQQVDGRATPQPIPRTAYQCTDLSERSQQVLTVRGTAQQGTPCCFPFVYKGQAYHGCTLTDNPQPWCGVETIYRESTNLWGNCQTIATPAPGVSQRCDAFPNSRLSNQYFTQGGTVPEGTPCCFPFVFKGRTYSACTRTDHNQMWCATDSIFQESAKRWGNCVQFNSQNPAPRPEVDVYICDGISSKSSAVITTGGGAVEGAPCCFPFVYQRQFYFGCTTQNHHRAWCAVENYYQPGRKNWGNCVSVSTPAPAVVAGPFNCSGTRSAEVVTRGGTVRPGTPCCFPFTYRGDSYAACTAMNHDKRWCAVENVFSETNKLWGNCVQQQDVSGTTTLAPGQYRCDTFRNSARSTEFVTRGGTVADGTPCCFPFIYKKRIYRGCTPVDNPRAWCAVESIYRSSKKLWGNCVLNAPAVAAPLAVDSLTPTPAPVTPTQSTPTTPPDDL